MTTSTTLGRVWDEAARPEALERAHRFEQAWQASGADQRPVPAQFLEGVHEADRPGVLLAVLRVDLALRRGAGEVARPELYRPEPGDETLVALLYEEYCLRQEAGEDPHSSEYFDRFPALVPRLRELFEIHELIAAEPGSTAAEFRDSSVIFPEAGQTIAGFLLVEELGRGSFARVFLARERQLADRPVALKVSRTGSREPQTLARLQHTHIVPVHSHRVDPTTGLHLLCMPYFGRITLAGLLESLSGSVPKTGVGLVTALDRLDEHREPEPGRQAVRDALASRSYPRAIAWWCARLAEGLRHAHDKGVLHRDIKPSNILVAGDGTPMLLDFNLAREPDEPTSRLGGTLAYMAPEHIEALIEGLDEGIDHRADVYALGMVLAEMLGSSPLGGSSPATTVLDSPSQLLAARRREVPRFGEIPPALEAVVRRCLAPEPDHRYGSAGDLATDLQAVADDSPLTFAREPWPSRARRWVRNNRSAMAVAIPVVMTSCGLIVLRFREQTEGLRVEAEVRGLIRDGDRSAEVGEFRLASTQFAMAADRASDRPALDGSRLQAVERRQVVEAAREARDRADAFFLKAEQFRFALLGFVEGRAEASRDLVAALEPFGVLNLDDWTRKPAVTLLDDRRRARLLGEVDDLLYFWVVAAAIDRPDPMRRREMASSVAACRDRALVFTLHRQPWVAIGRWWASPPDPAPHVPVPTGRESADLAFRWYLIGQLNPDRTPAMAWLELSAKQSPGNYWHQFVMAYEHERTGETERAWSGYSTAIALRPDVPWAWKNRAILQARVGEWTSALDDLDRAFEVCRSPIDLARVRLERGQTYQRIGDFRLARADYRAAIAADPVGVVARDAGRDLARLEADSGAIERAFAVYDGLLLTDPTDFRSRWGRARLSLRVGRPAAAERDLELMPPECRVAVLPDLAATQFALGRPAEARTDASLALAERPNAALERLRNRANLAMGLPIKPWPDRPDAFDTLPFAGRALRDDLLKLSRNESSSIRSILLSAVLDHAGALAEADRLVTESPRSSRLRLLRARIRDRAGLPDQALADVAAGLAVEPESADLVELRGSIRGRDRRSWCRPG